jgi:hypothetical protein
MDWWMREAAREDMRERHPLIMRFALFSALLLVAGVFPVAAAPLPLPTAHEARSIHGWTVRVDRRLLEGPDAQIGAEAVALLSQRLAEIARLVPAEPLRRLREVPMQLDLTHGDLKPAQYHPNSAWLREHGYSEALAKCVHIPRAAQWTAAYEIHRMPWALLHEFAHAYHDQVLDFEEPRIKAAWVKFRDSGRYEKVLTIKGEYRKHYALTNHKEFFAEMTEAYFGTNDFYPFVAGELQEAEPEIFQLMAEIWGALPRRESVPE